MASDMSLSTEVTAEANEIQQAWNLERGQMSCEKYKLHEIIMRKIHDLVIVYRLIVTQRGLDTKLPPSSSATNTAADYIDNGEVLRV